MPDNTKNLYELREGAEKLKEIELALAYIQDVLVAISNLAISGDIIAEVAAHLDEIDTCANNINDIITCSTNIVDINSVATNIASVVTCATNIASIVTVSTDITNVNLVAGSITDINNIADNLAQVLASLDDALDAGSWANEDEDIPVKVYTGGVPTDRVPTVFSAKHWSLKTSATGLPTPTFPADEGKIFVYRAAGNAIEDNTATDTTKVLKTGDTMTGDLNVPSIIATTAISSDTLTSEDGTTITMTISDLNTMLTQSAGGKAMSTGWLLFDGESTPAILAEFNISGIVKDATGTYTISFTTAMDNINYTVSGTADRNGSSMTIFALETGKTVSSFQIKTSNTSANILTDTNLCSLHIFGGKA